MLWQEKNGSQGSVAREYSACKVLSRRPAVSGLHIPPVRSPAHPSNFQLYKACARKVRCTGDQPVCIFYAPSSGTWSPFRGETLDVAFQPRGSRSTQPAVVQTGPREAPAGAVLGMRSCCERHASGLQCMAAKSEGFHSRAETRKGGGRAPQDGLCVRPQHGRVGDKVRGSFF